MIVRMLKLSVVCLEHDRDATLEQLRDLGVLHVASAQAPGGADVDAARTAVERARTALACLPATAGTTASGRGEPEAAAGARDAAAVLARLETLRSEQRDLEQRTAVARAERDAMVPFGDFDPDQARALEAHGARLRLYRFPTRGPVPVVPTGAVLHVLGTEAGTTCAVLVGPPDATLDAREQPLPARSLSELERELTEGAARRDAIDREIAALASARTELEQLLEQREDDLQLAQTRAQMGTEDRLAWLSGFCPAAALDGVLAAARAGGFAVVATTPAADDVVPTELEDKPWVRQVHAVLDMIGIRPGYTEADVSPVFLVFLLVFAAMLIGDAGYGALLVLGAALARRKWRDAPAQPFRLLRSVGVATIAWGALTGTWFAIPHLPAVLDGMRIEWLAGADKGETARHVMLLCFFLGAVHITLAHVWSAIRCGRRPAALAQLGWIATTWCMFFLARTMVLGEPFPPLMVPITVAGVGAIVLFMTPLAALRHEWFNHVMLPLNLVSNFVDVVSYLRLFAVGTAGVAVAGAFNDMAARIGAGGGGSLVLAALVAIFGHTLNLALCAMGVLVHGVRLNTLEFSAHLGLQWSGVPYRPLRRRAASRPATDSNGID